MFAAQFDRFGPPDVLTVGPFVEPHAGVGQVRVRVRAAGISPVDVALRAGLSPSAKQVRVCPIGLPRRTAERSMPRSTLPEPDLSPSSSHSPARQSR
jgi:hypothetical protein